MSLVSFQNGRLIYKKKKWLPFYILEKDRNKNFKNNIYNSILNQKILMVNEQSFHRSCTLKTIKDCWEKLKI